VNGIILTLVPFGSCGGQVETNSWGEKEKQNARGQKAKRLKVSALKETNRDFVEMIKMYSHREEELLTT